MNRLLRLTGSAERATLRADDALRHGEREILAERIADREHPFADARRVAVAERRGGEAGRVDLDHGDVGVRIAADDLGLELAPVEQAHAHFARAVDDVVVREDVSVRRDDEARAGRDATAARSVGCIGRLRAGHVPEELSELGRNLIQVGRLSAGPLRDRAALRASR